jgi:hypothetical protein
MKVILRLKNVVSKQHHPGETITNCLCALNENVVVIKQPILGHFQIFMHS